MSASCSTSFRARLRRAASRQYSLPVREGGRKGDDQSLSDSRKEDQGYSWEERRRETRTHLAPGEAGSKARGGERLGAKEPGTKVCTLVAECAVW